MVNKKYHKLNNSSYILFLFPYHFYSICATGYSIGKNFINFAISLLKILPVAFILIGLFEVWVKSEVIEKHLGETSGLMGYVWAIILASTTIGGIFVSLPVAQTLHKKGACLRIIFTYITASTITRIPMSIFEASFLGVKFTLIRLLVSLPLVILSSILMEKTTSSVAFQTSEMIEAKEK